MTHGRIGITLANSGVMRAQRRASVSRPHELAAQLLVRPPFCTGCTDAEAGNREILFPKATLRCTPLCGHMVSTNNSVVCELRNTLSTGQRNATLVTS